MKLIGNAVFRKNTKNMRKHRDIKLVTTEARSDYLVSQPNHHTTTSISHRNERKKKEKLMNKLVYLGLSILKISKILMYVNKNNNDIIIIMI